MSLRTLGSLALALIAATVGGCASPRWSEPIIGPLPVQEKPPERGRVVYLQNCYSCHQGGEGGLGPPINAGVSRLFTKLEVRHGLGAMPAFDQKRMSDQELDDLMAYLAALRRQRQAGSGDAAE